MISNFNEWKNKSTEEVNEFFGIKKLIKSFFKSLSEPIRIKVDSISKHIDDKTGEVTNTKTLSKELISTFKLIADDKKADLKNVDNIDVIKAVLKEFIISVKAVFAASRVPYTAMVESIDIEFDEFLNEAKHSRIARNRRKPSVTSSNQPEPEQEPLKPLDIPTPKDLKIEFSKVMNSKESEFEDYLEVFLDDWVASKGEISKDKLSIEASKIIDSMMNTFKKKIEGFGSERLEKLIKLGVSKPNATEEDIKKVENSDENGDSVKVETTDGKEEFLDAAYSDLSKIEMYKTKNDDDTYDIVIKNIELK